MDLLITNDNVKISCLLTGIALVWAAPAVAQTDSPYARFGYEGRVLRTPQERPLLLVPNPDTAAAVAKIGLDPAAQQYYLFGKDNQVLKGGAAGSAGVASQQGGEGIARGALGGRYDGYVEQSPRLAHYLHRIITLPKQVEHPRPKGRQLGVRLGISEPRIQVTNYLLLPGVALEQQPAVRRQQQHRQQRSRQDNTDCEHQQQRPGR